MVLRNDDRLQSLNPHKPWRYSPYSVKVRMKTLSCTLFGFQTRAIQWLWKKRKSALRKQKDRGVLINIDVGLGKTVISTFASRRWGWNLLYLCPSNTERNVQDDLLKHFGKTIKIAILDKWPDAGYVTADINIMTYNTLSRIDAAIPSAHPHVFTTCILDEIQEICHTKGVKRALESWLQSDFYIGLTARNKPELKPLLHILRASSYRDVFVFRQPPQFEKRIFLTEMSTPTRAQYEKIETQVIEGNNKPNAIKRLLNSSWELLSLDKVSDAMDVMKQLQPHWKVLIVSKYSSTLGELADAIADKKKYVLLETKLRGSEKRVEKIKRFREVDACTIMLASLSIINLGLNFGFVDVMIIMEPPRSSDKRDQLCGRLRRCGQRPKHVTCQFVVELVAKDSSDFELFKNNEDSGGDDEEDENIRPHQEEKNYFH